MRELKKDIFDKFSNFNEKQIEKKSLIEKQEILKILIQIGDLKNSKKLLKNIYEIVERKKELSFQNEQNSNLEIIYLNILTKYLNSIKDKKKQNTEFNYFLKTIKNSYNLILESFDGIYILIKNSNNIDNSNFNSLNNAILINTIENLVELLNEFEENELADNFFMLKRKLELGFVRYFYNKEHNIILSEFNKNGKYNIANNYEIIQILNNFIFDKNYLDDFYKNLDIKKELKNNNNLFEVLELILFIKKFDKKKATTELKKFKTILHKKYPTSIISEDEKNIENTIVNSINKQLLANIEEIDLTKKTKNNKNHKNSKNNKNTKTNKKENNNLIIKNLNSEKTMNLVLEIIE